MKAHWGEGEGEYCWAITGGEMAMLPPIRFECAGVGFQLNSLIYIYIYIYIYIG